MKTLNYHDDTTRASKRNGAQHHMWMVQAYRLQCDSRLTSLNFQHTVLDSVTIVIENFIYVSINGI